MGRYEEYEFWQRWKWVTVAVGMVAVALGMGGGGDGYVLVIVGRNSVYFVVFQYCWVNFGFGMPFIVFGCTSILIRYSLTFHLQVVQLKRVLKLIE